MISRSPQTVMPVVSVSMPESLLDRIDEFIEEEGYSGRSEAVREGARLLLGEFEGPVGDDVESVFVVSTTFAHESGAEAELSDLRHEFDDLVTTNLHSHAGGDCLELFVVEGQVGDVGSFVARLRAVDGVNGVEHSRLSADRVATT